jgi:glycosyltransferase involved in cell wall biosynthesis
MTVQVAVLHYTAPPVVGGVEAVMQAHAAIFVQNGYPVTIITGRGERSTFSKGVELRILPEIDSLHPQIAEMSDLLAQGNLPAGWVDMVAYLETTLAPILERFDHLIVHNVFTKHFNLPLTAALYRLLDAGSLRHCIAWCHDSSWASPTSRSKVHPGYPWDLLRTCRDGVTYVAVSQERQQALAEIYGCARERIHVVYNGVDPIGLLGLSSTGRPLVERLGLLESDLVLLMPVRVTRAKNIEYALRVVAALKDQGCRPKLILTGPPDPHDAGSMAYYAALRALRQQLGVEEEMRFVFESGPDPERPFTIDPAVVGDLYRVSDMLFMPSHREGFGMPVLEAGLVRLPVVCTAIPAATEIGAPDVLILGPAQAPEQAASQILSWAAQNPQHRLRRRVRQGYTWQAIFRRHIEPLLVTHTET